MLEPASKPLRWRAAEVAAHVVDASRIEPRIRRGDRVRAPPEGLAVESSAPPLVREPVERIHPLMMPGRE